MDETTRIRNAYARRDSSGKPQLYTYFKPFNLHIYRQRENAILKALLNSDMSDLRNRRILDVGCGKGGALRDFVRYGAKPENCFGIDLLPDRIEAAKRISPNMNFRYGNAECLPYDDSSFDIILIFTVFSSIFDEKMKLGVAAEIKRTLKPHGVILWFDFFMDNPWNPDVRGIRKNDIYHMFQGYDITLKRIALAIPLARVIAPASIILCQVLEKLPFLCTHYIGTIRKSSSGGRLI